MDPRIEEVLQELQDLARKKPLSNDDLQRAKQLMTTLREMGFTNADVSELTNGGWKESTVKLYTRGAKVDNPGPRIEAISSLKELVNRNLSLDDVAQTLSAVKLLNTKGVSLERILNFLSDIETAKVILKDLIATHDEVRRSKLTVELINEALSFKKDLKTLGVTTENLNAILQTSKQYGNPDAVLKAITEYGTLKSIESSIAQLEKDKASLRGSVNELTGTLQSLKNQEKQIKDNLTLYRSFEAEGLDLDLLKKLRPIFDKYGGIKEFLNAINAYSKLVELQNEISRLETKKTDLEATLKRIEADHAHLKHVIITCDTLLYKYGFSVQAIETLHKVSRTYGGALPVLEAIGKYKQLKDIENEVDKASATKNELDSNVKELEKQTQSMRGVVNELQKSVTRMLNSLSTRMIEAINQLEAAFTKATTDTSSSFKSAQENLTKAYIDTLTVIEQKLPATLRTLGQIDEKINRSKDLAILLDLMEKPAEIKDQTSKVMTYALAFVTALQTYATLNKERISNEVMLRDPLDRLRIQLTESVRIELGKTQAGS